MQRPSELLILGSTGFVGRHLESACAARGTSVAGFGSRQLDLRDSAQLQVLDSVIGPNTVVIVASASGAGSAMTPQGLVENITMVVNMAKYLSAGSAPPARKCVFLSSDAVYPMLDEPVDETSPIDTTTLYAVAKLGSERVLQHVLPKAGIPVLILRLTSVFGPGDTHNAYGPNRFARGVASAQPVRLFGNGEERRDHIFIDDVIATILALCETDQSGVLNLACGESRSFRSVIDGLNALSAQPVEVETLPRSSPITHRDFDTARLRQALPQMKFTAFEEGLRATLEASLREISVVSTGRG